MRFILKNFRTVKIKFCVLAIVILGIYLIASIAFEVSFTNKYNATHYNFTVNLTYVVMHIDLKGTPLKLSYLKSLLPMLKENGVNSLLMEYEDMFPYDGRLVNLSAENCYKKKELRQFLQTAVESGFDIIPLVQTFGHLEYALKLPEFQHLREDHQYPDSICPSRPESRAFIQYMMEQVIDFHNTITPLKYIHIGCDEVFHINKCQHCKLRNLDKRDIFLQHVKTLSGVIKSQYAGITVLIWDDMLRGINPNKWKRLDQFTNVEPVYWDYQGTSISHTTMYKYHTKFKNIWIASAYKGADGRVATVPNLKRRLQNIFNWLSFIADYKFGGENCIYKFKGIILTGWSRYSHMDPPCELLPVSIPSLIHSLTIIKTYKVRAKDDTTAIDDDDDYLEYFYNAQLSIIMMNKMGCVLNLENYDIEECHFDGKEMYDVMRSYVFLSKNVDKMFSSEDLGLQFVEFHSKFGLINRNTIDTNRRKLLKNLKELLDFENKLPTVMSKYYEIDFITEYMHSKTYHIRKKIQKLLDIYDGNQHIDTWQRRSNNVTYFTP